MTKKKKKKEKQWHFIYLFLIRNVILDRGYWSGIWKNHPVELVGIARNQDRSPQDPGGLLGKRRIPSTPQGRSTSEPPSSLFGQATTWTCSKSPEQPRTVNKPKEPERKEACGKPGFAGWTPGLFLASLPKESSHQAREAPRNRPGKGVNQGRPRETWRRRSRGGTLEDPTRQWPLGDLGQPVYPPGS